jgi:hypothetical protein
MEKYYLKLERFKQIKTLVKEWQNKFPSMTVKDSLFALYDDKMITGHELDLLMCKLDGLRKKICLPYEV